MKNDRVGALFFFHPRKLTESKGKGVNKKISTVWVLYHNHQANIVRIPHLDFPITTNIRVRTYSGPLPGFFSTKWFPNFRPQIKFKALPIKTPPDSRDAISYQLEMCATKIQWNVDKLSSFFIVITGDDIHECLPALSSQATMISDFASWPLSFFLWTTIFFWLR